MRTEAITSNSTVDNKKPVLKQSTNPGLSNGGVLLEGKRSSRLIDVGVRVDTEVLNEDDTSPVASRVGV